MAVGGGDGSCAGVGVGCIRPGTAYNYLGSSSWIALTVEKPIVDPQMRTMNWAHCVPGYLHPSGTMQTAGSSYQWLKNAVCTSEVASAAGAGRRRYELIDRQPLPSSPPGANGVLFLPYMLGERTPWWNPKRRGAFIGLNLATRREDMLRAVMEGITHEPGHHRQHLPAARADRRRSRSSAAGPRAAVWRQMMADIYDCRDRVAEFPGRGHLDGRGGDRRRGGGRSRASRSSTGSSRVEHVATPNAGEPAPCTAS